MAPSPTQGMLFPHGANTPPNLGWSQIYDYQGGNQIIYVLWYPTGSGQSAIGYIQKYTYSGSNVTNIQWAVVGNVPNPTAVWANRITLTYN